MLIGDVLAERAGTRPDSIAFSFTDSDGSRSTVTYQDLWSTVRAMAGTLQGAAATGDRVLLLCDPSLGYLQSFFAIVSAGLVAVPAYPASATRHADRVRRIVEDCRPAIVIADVPEPSDLQALGLPEGCVWLEVSSVRDGDRPEGAAPFARPDLAGDDLAFLQYTSGSTGSPKGVMVSHANLLSNAESARTTFGFHPGSVMVSWLPPFHDMGLIGCIITPLVVGFPCHLMAPSTFLRRPLKWLEAISELRATDSTAPNFAYRLCAERVDEADLGSLDLSSWTKAMNGAEPVSVEALEKFAQAYASTGFVPTSYRPCYGMAEATLLISGGHPGDSTPRSASPQRATTEAGGGEFVSCGTPEPHATVRIVDPATGTPVPDGSEGEIWVSSPSVARGYWNKPEATAETFAVTTTDGEGPFLRTGDLGFLDGGELFVTGRIKDILIINGRNLYPQDLEDAVRGSHPELTGRASAAFEDDGRIVVTVEAVPGRKVTREDLGAIARAAATGLSRSFEIASPLVVVLRRGTLTTTSSGKIQRSSARTAWRDGSHAERTIARSDTGAVTEPAATPAAEPAATPAATPAPMATGPRPGAAGVRAVVLAELARASGHGRQPSPATLLSDLGLDSVKVAALATAIEDRTGIEVPLSLAWEVDDVESFVAAVVQASSRVDGPLPVEATVEAEPGPSSAQVVVVGAACRLPGGVTGPDAYWDLLTAGPDRTGISPGSGRTGRHPAGLVPELADFAPARFGIGEEEAAAMDPRQRLTLTLAWEAMEDAGRDPRRVRGARIGVYLGGSDGEYLRTEGSTASAAAPGYRTTGAAGALLANRISYVLGLRGPSMVVDTACSSSLVAVDLAVQALRAGDIDGALVGGVSALLDGRVTETLAAAGMLSPRGACSTFDESADGYVRGEGGVMLFLERQTAGTLDGPDPYCAIVGSAVNQDGRSNGLTAPSGLAQQDVVREALAAAGRSPEDIGYIEAHGTGTPLGDPVEVHSLRQVLDRDVDGPTIWLGSAKAQIGHLEASAGVAGLLRAALVVRAGSVPAQAQFRTPSTRIDWKGSRLRVPTEQVAWDAPRRTAGVSSFGFGGTNAHVVIESVDRRPASAAPRGDEDPVLVRISADSENGLRRQAFELQDKVGASEPVGAVAAALDRSRASGRFRAWTVARGSDDAREVLGRLGGEPVAECRTGGPASGAPTVAFLAAGHGAPVAGCLAGIYGDDPVVTAVLDDLGDTSRLPLRALLVDDEETRAAMRRTEVAQPAHFALAVALGERLRAWGLEPAVVTGHSVGAFAAAALAGIFDRSRGYELITRRGELMEATPEGGMLACQAGLDVARGIAAEAGLDVAVANSPVGTVLSGTLDDLARAEELLRGQGLRGTRLPVTRAFHSRLMRSVEEGLAEAVTAAGPRPASRAVFLSDVDGSTDAAVATPGYWTGHALETIDFRAAARAAAEYDVVVELGPSYLLPLVQANAGDRPPLTVAALGRGGGMASLLEGAGRLWASGVTLDGVARWTGRIPRLPTTVLATHTYPLEPSSGAGPVAGHALAPAAGAVVQARASEDTGRPGDPEAWAALLCDRLGARLGLSPDRVPRETGLFDLGLTSVIANDLREEVAGVLGRPLSSTVVFDHPTVSRLAAHLSALGSTEPAGRVPSSEPAVRLPAPQGTAAARGPVSVVGMACRFPGAETLQDFWSLVSGGGSVMTEPPAGRWPDADEVPPPGERQWSAKAGFLATDPAVFAADHFGISPREARSMDPQHRMLLNTTHEALGDAGISREELRGARVGIWVGLSSADYASLRPRTSAPDAYAVTGNSPSLASGRIAHHLGVEGPAVTLDTACSSSLVACHEAVQALRAGTVDLAVVGGVNLMLSARTTAALGDMGALSASGRCSTFAADADGYARGEGCGVVVLRRQEDALGRGDRIWFDLLGTAVNHDGVSAGLTVPNGGAQERLITEALQDAGLSAHQIDYVEAHGTGTPLGDPIELEALSRVFDDGRDRPLPVSSVKAQIGHLEAAAGIAALIKAGLVAGKGVVPAHPRDLVPTPRFDWSASRLELAGADPSHRPEGPLACGVSSFGFSGTNAHVVLSGAPDRSADDTPGHQDEAGADVPQLLLVSSDTEDGLREQQLDLADLLSDHENRLDETARSLRHRADHAEHRFAVVAQDAEEAIRVLRAAAGADPGADPAETGSNDGHVGSNTSGRRATWLFSGVGSQWKGMVRHLRGDPATREHLARADELLRAMGHPPLEGDLWHASGRQEHLQPALTAVQVALASALRGLGGHRDEVVGYSAGLVGALVDTAWLDLETGLRVAAWRGRVTDAAAGTGATVACGLGAEEVRALCLRDGLDDLVVASVTGPANCTVSGAVDQLALLEDECRRAGAWWMPVSDKVPFHHPRLKDFADAAAGIPDLTWGTGDGTPVHLAGGSTVEDLVAEPGRLLDELWQPMDLSLVRSRLADPAHPRTLVEVAPQPSLGAATSEWPGAPTMTPVPLSVPGRHPARQVRRAAAALWVQGSGTAPQPAGSARSAVARLEGERYWWDDQVVERAVGSVPDDGSSYRLRWTTDNGRPVRCAARPSDWVVVGGTDPAVGESLRDAVVARGHTAGLRSWAEPWDGPATDGGRHGVLVDATGAPDPLADGAWHERLLRLLQTLGGAGTEVWVITRGATTAGGPVEVGPAAVWGLARALSTEHPEWWGGAIDLSAGEVWSARLAARVADEALDGGTEDQVALRGGARRVPRLAPVPAGHQHPLDLAGDAGYLVTGGSGTLGRRMLRWLVDRGARHLVLAARSGAATQRERLADLADELKARGAELYFVQADVADLAQLEPIVAETGRPWPAVRGVLHLAGHMSSGPFSEVTAADLRASWEPKAGGALALEEIARRHPLDFVVLFSSASSVWGSAMATAYVSANYGLDVIAERAAAQGLPFMSANWSWWPDTAMADGVHEYFTRMGLGPVDEDAGWAAMDRLVGQGDVGLVVAPIDWGSFRPVMSARRPRPMFDEIGRGDSGPAGAAGPGPAARTEPWTRAEIEERLTVALRTVLRTDGPVDPRQGFFDMGIDSIMTLELKRDIESWSGERLDDAFLFEHPRLTDLTEALLQVLAPETLEHAAAAPAGAAGATTGLDDLGTDELLSLLEQELGSVKGPGHD
ncbi:type I polyketide synthase [Antribacter gilvus]|uniref:type I polyketide synthase n=1 Tax=Antribacter gilvus TaxID=2304675 RepID=UPI0013E07537|nr:type I polyketide synthase [Antribacter gilvus]